jgi:hypothetical protein
MTPVGLSALEALADAVSDDVEVSSWPKAEMVASRGMRSQFRVDRAGHYGPPDAWQMRHAFRSLWDNLARSWPILLSRVTRSTSLLTGD